MMGAGLGVGVDRHRARPELLGADPCEIDRRAPVHTRRLSGVGIEPVAGNDLHAVMLPGRRGRRPLAMRMIGHSQVPKAPLRFNSGPKKACHGALYAASSAFSFRSPAAR